MAVTSVPMLGLGLDLILGRDWFGSLFQEPASWQENDSTSHISLFPNTRFCCLYPFMIYFFSLGCR